MIKALVTDVSRVLLFPKNDAYNGSLNALYKKHSFEPGFKFFDYFIINEELLNFYKNLDISIHILTSDIIQDALELQPYWEGVIDKIFSASKMSVNKASIEAYKKVIEELNVEAEELIYVDDNQDNLTAAKNAGLTTILFENNEQTFKEIMKLL